ncbi:hypothetical protein OSTOST_06643, partial [Ostertagia ostertagi]
MTELGKYADIHAQQGVISVLNILTAGASPERSMMDALTQIMLGGIFRGIILVYLGYFNGIVKKCYRRRLLAKESCKADYLKLQSWESPVSLALYIDRGSSGALQYLLDLHRCNRTIAEK